MSRRKTIEAVGGLADKVGEAFDKNFTSQEERLEARNNALAKVQEVQMEVRQMAHDLTKLEVSGNGMQRSWRPTLMYIFGLIILVKETAWIFGAEPPEVDEQIWEMVKISLGVFGGGRSLEKIASTVAPMVAEGMAKRRSNN